MLALFLAAPLIRAGKLRNLAFLLLLALFFAANLAFHLGRLERLPGGAFIGLGFAADVIAIVVAIIGGRIIPAFTQSGLRQRGVAFQIPPLPLLDAAAIAALVLVLASDMLPLDRAIVGGIALLAALLHGVRLARWGGLKTRPDPAALGAAPRLRLSGAGSGAEGRQRSDRCRHRRQMDARADRRLFRDHDPGRDDARVARPYRAPAGPAKRHCRRLCCWCRLPP